MLTHDDIVGDIYAERTVDVLDIHSRSDNGYSEVDRMVIEYENTIRSDERRKFIAFISEHTHCRTDCENFLNCDGNKCWNKYLDMYEEEHKDE